MKTFFKNNLIWMFALVLSIGTMSFKLAEKNLPSVERIWFIKTPTGWVQESSTPSDDPTSVDCPLASGEKCAKGFNPDAVPGSVVDTTPAHDERYRSN